MLRKSKLRNRFAGKIFGRRMPEMPGSSPATTPASIAELAWYTRAVTLGAAPPAATRNAVKAFFASFFAAGFVLADFDYIYLMIGEASGDTSANKYNQKRVNLVNPGTFDATVVNPNASGHAALGTVGNASMYWLTGFNSTTRIVNRGANNATLGCVTSAVAAGGTVAAMGVNDSHKFLSNNVTVQRVKYGGTDNDTVGLPTFPCLNYGEATTGATSIYQGATQAKTAVQTNADLPANDMAIFGQWNGTAPFQRTDETLALAFQSRALTGTGERTAWYTMVQTLMAAFGVTI